MFLLYSAIPSDVYACDGVTRAPGDREMNCDFRSLRAFQHVSVHYSLGEEAFVGGMNDRWLEEIVL